MKKISFTFFITLISLTYCFSQDLIIKKTKEEIKSKVIEVSISEIKFKRFDNPEGPVYTLLKSDILKIIYQNGSKDEFENETTKTLIDMRHKGVKDALINYSGHKSGAGWVGVTSIFFTPLAGLIPAIACSATEPKDKNLNYKNTELMKDNNYNQAYRAEAYRIKKKKIWTSFGVGSGIYLVLFLILN